MENGVPNHLKPYVVVTKEAKTLNDEFMVAGSVKCPCGSETFTIIRDKWEQSAESKEAENQINALYEKHRKAITKKDGHLCEMSGENGKWYIAYSNFIPGKERLLEDITELNKIFRSTPYVPTFFEAVCSQCGQKILVFDSSQHGYDSLAAAEIHNYVKEFKTVKKAKCRKCGSDASKITVKISSTGKDDLFTECGDLINNSNWENAFDWITVDLECGGCDKETKKYLDLETM